MTVPFLNCPAVIMAATSSHSKGIAVFPARLQVIVVRALLSHPRNPAIEESHPVRPVFEFLLRYAISQDGPLHGKKAMG